MPRSQVENERVFFVAGIISKNRRNLIGGDEMNIITSMYYNVEERALYIMYLLKATNSLDTVIDEEIDFEDECENR